MLTLELMSNGLESVVYRYYPEGETKYGVVSVSKVDGKWSFDKLVEEYGTKYAAHACAWIAKRIKEKKIPEKGMVAWY